MKILHEVRKEDELYYQGAFWLIANSFADIMRGNFSLLGNKLVSDFDGNIYDNSSKNSRSHQNLWKNKYKSELNSDKDYTYYPRGRVAIYKGVAYIHINSKCNTPKIIDTIINEYNIGKLEIEIELNDK